jgi:hypothetical protein
MKINSAWMRRGSLAAAAMLCTAVSPSIPQVPPRAADQPIQPPRARTQAIAASAQGTVQQSSGDVVVVQRQGEPDLSLRIDQQTQVLKNGEPVTTTELQNGNIVSVQYRADRDQAIAERIEISDTSIDQPSAPQVTQPAEVPSSQP